MECSDRTRIIMRCLDYARHDRRGILSRDDRGRFLDCARNDRRGTLSRDDIQAPSCQVPVPLTCPSDRRMSGTCPLTGGV